jgi:thiol-disulfide isomerase/thioredoxin
MLAVIHNTPILVVQNQLSEGSYELQKFNTRYFMNERMKAKLFFFSMGLVLAFGCTTKRSEPDLYRNMFTGEIMDGSEYQKFRDSLLMLKFDSLNGQPHVTIHFGQLESSGDSVIAPFRYSIRVGDEYIVRENSFEKIGMNVPQRTFITLHGDSLQIGGEQSKPTLINLWFVGCTGCVQEMPALNKLQEKYGDRVNFIAMTFDDEKKVTGFLKRKEFTYEHIVNAEDFIKLIGTQPYPENIFINKKGYIENIEGGLPDNEIEHFESIIEKLLSQ